MRSVGVTATTLSTHPAAIPARIPRPGESFPFSSAKMLRMVSKDKNLTPALNAVPYNSENCCQDKTLAASLNRKVDYLRTHNDEGRAAGVNGRHAIVARNLGKDSKRVP